MAEEVKEETKEPKFVPTIPVVETSDMLEEMKVEATELIVTACEKFGTNNELAARAIKDSFDNKFGPSWHAVVGEGFGFDISYQCKTLLYVFFGGNTAICTWKC